MPAREGRRRARTQSVALENRGFSKTMEALRAPGGLLPEAVRGGSGPVGARERGTLI